jgi:hypothetical protein
MMNVEGPGVTALDHRARKLHRGNDVTLEPKIKKFFLVHVAYNPLQIDD